MKYLFLLSHSSIASWISQIQGYWSELVRILNKLLPRCLRNSPKRISYVDKKSFQCERFGFIFDMQRNLFQELHWQIRTLRTLRGYRHAEHHYWGNTCQRSTATKCKEVLYELSCSDVTGNLIRLSNMLE